MDLLLIRHAEPKRTVVDEGAADPELHERGVRQAELLADYLADESLDALYSSPMRRARLTAAPLSARLGLPIGLDDDLAEFDRHSTTYVPYEELRAKKDPQYLALVDGDFSGFGVDMDAFRVTSVSAVERIITAHPGAAVAVICHGGVINSYCASVLDLKQPWFFNPDYTSISRIAASRKGDRQILCLNETTHLRGTGLLTSFASRKVGERPSGQLDPMA